MKYFFVYGTTAELLKIYPVVKLLPKDDVSLLSTQQQPVDLRELEIELGITSKIDLLKKHARPLTRTLQIPLWAIRGFFAIRKHLRNLDGIVIVHGDTLTSLIGGLAAKSRRLRLVHIEAGLRSGSWTHPFPEELIRRTTALYSDVNFAPNVRASQNLSKSPGIVVNTMGNTIEDSLVAVQPRKPDLRITNQRFAIVSLHRRELLSNEKVLRGTVSAIQDLAQAIQVVLIIDSLTDEALVSKKLDWIYEAPGVVVSPKLNYPEFQWLLREASFLVTDSGGQQEEAARLGLPTLVHRMHTERPEGLGENIALSNWDSKKVVDFAIDYSQLLVPPREIVSGQSPSKIIASYLGRMAR